MNTRAAIFALALAAGTAWTPVQATESVPPPLRSPLGPDVRSSHPLGALRNGTYARHRQLPNDRFLREDGGLSGSNLRPERFLHDNEASTRQATEDNSGGLTPVDSWLPPTSGTRRNGRRETVRVVRNALRDALAESTELDEMILSSTPFQNENRGTPESSSSTGSWEDRVRFRVGVSHLSPKVEMRCDMGGGALGLSVSALGQVHVDLAPSRTGSGTIQAGLDPVEGRYSAGYRLTF